ncbi:MAG: carbohydrate kinase family protein [Promethearchaeota archaeon]
MSKINENISHENVFPYILLLPIDSEKRHAILKNVFSSEIGLKIFRKLGTGDILQKNIIETLKGHSNKTIIQKLKLFEELGLLESSEKEINRRRLLSYSLSKKMGKWIALLLSEVPKDTIENVFTDLFHIYLDHSLNLALELGFELELLHDIFHKRVAHLSLQSIRKDIQIPKNAPEVVVFGSAAMDLVIKSELPDVDELIISDNIHKLPGGSAANVAVALSELGVQTSFVGKLGGDFNSLLLLKEFIREGVDISNLKIEPNKKTPEPVVLVGPNGEKRIIAPYGDDIALSIETPEEIDWRLLKSARCLYIGDMFREVSAVVSSYGHNYDKLVVYRPSTAYMKQGVESIELILQNTDFLLVNSKGWELLKSSSMGKLSTPTDLLNYGCSTIIITQGIHGCSIYQPGRDFTVPAEKVDAVDTTGAGDAFAAGLIKGLLETTELYDAVRRALRYASHSVQQLGARSAYSTFNTLKT